MKVVWLCHFSNGYIRERLQIKTGVIVAGIRKILRKSEKGVNDFAPWITNGIHEFENLNEVKLHVIAPHYGISKRVEKFQLNNIHYYFYKPDDNSLLLKSAKKIFKIQNCKYKSNRCVTSELISQIQPDIIHMYGAENPYYSITALDIDTKKFPFFVSMTTLLNDKDFRKNYPISEKSYNFRAGIEYEVLKKAEYIGSTVKKYRGLVWNNINPEAIFFKTYLGLEHELPIIHCNKQFDFVYFSTSIDKAADVAIEAFALACKKYPNLTINMIGDMPAPFTEKLRFRIMELGIEKNVFFSGRIFIHKELLTKIQLSKFALLPLKIDIISGTIREAMFTKLPVVTTITPGTPLLNEKRESILLSQQNDYQSIADNMIKLIESPTLAETLAENAFLTANERWDNRKSMLELIDVYNAIIQHHNQSLPIPNHLGEMNPQSNQLSTKSTT